jgi:isoquinoline 1-oxidoreductase alpha subunit
VTVKTMSLNINGQVKTVTCDDATPLLWVLRDILGMTGTKYGCGVEICKACTVWIDGSAEKSCLLQVKEVLSVKLTTIEGLSATKEGRAVQKAWVDNQVPQCGFCQSGVLLSLIHI